MMRKTFIDRKRKGWQKNQDEKWRERERQRQENTKEKINKKKSDNGKSVTAPPSGK